MSRMNAKKTQADIKKSSPWSQGRKTPFGRARTYDVLSIQRESWNGTKNTRKKRHHLQMNKRKKKKHVLRLSGRLRIEGRLNEGPRLQRKHIKSKTKQNKTNLTSEKDAMTSANQTPGGYKLAPLVASQQKRRENQHDCVYMYVWSSHIIIAEYRSTR